MTDERPTGPDGIDACSDETLVERTAAADRTAFAALFARYAGRIKAYLMRVGTEADLAEEAAQEVMVILWRKAGSFDASRASAATWIFTIARNRRIDLIRKARRPAPDAHEPMLQSDPEPGAEADLAGRERDAQVRAAMAGLSPDQRDVVRLAFFAELSHGEIATRLDVPLGTVKSRLRLAFARLKRDLGLDFAGELHND